MKRATLLLAIVCLSAPLVSADDIVIWRDDMAAEGRQFWGGCTQIASGPGYRTVDMTGTGLNTGFVTDCSVPVKAGDVIKTTYVSSWKDFTTGMLYYMDSETVIIPTVNYTTAGPHTDQYTFSSDTKLNRFVLRNWVNWRPYVNLTFQGNSIVRPDSRYVWHNDMTDASKVRPFNGTVSDANGFVEVTCTSTQTGVVLFEGSTIDVKAGAELRVNFNAVTMPADNSFQDVFLQIGGVATVCNTAVTNGMQYSFVYEFTEDATVSYIYFRPRWGDGGTIRLTDAMIIESVPEPATVALLSIGGIAALARKRK